MNFKEKNKYLRELHAPTHALKDLELLKKLDPRNDQLSTFEHAPERHAERILYTLLDIATPEEIRNNRRKIDLAKEKELAETEKGARIDQEEAESDSGNSILESQNSKLLEQLDDAELERDETIAEKEELEEQVFELEETVETLKSELEEEKKSKPRATDPAAPKSKKKPSTQTSSGKTSKTKTSK